MVLEGSEIPDPDFGVVGVHEAGGSDDEWDELSYGPKEGVSWEGKQGREREATKEDGLGQSAELLSAYCRDEVDRDSSDVEMVSTSIILIHSFIRSFTHSQSFIHSFFRLLLIGWFAY